MCGKAVVEDGSAVDVTTLLILGQATFFGLFSWQPPTKKDPSKKHTLMMMGEIWAKLSSQYCKELAKGYFHDIFEPMCLSGPGVDPTRPCGASK